MSDLLPAKKKATSLNAVASRPARNQNLKLHHNNDVAKAKMSLMLDFIGFDSNLRAMKEQPWETIGGDANEIGTTLYECDFRMVRVKQPSDPTPEVCLFFWEMLWYVQHTDSINSSAKPI